MSSDPDFMTSLARGLSVLRLFEQHEVLTASKAASNAGLSRAAARRCLYTLERLGYLAPVDGGSWRLRPALLPLARAFLRSTLAEAAQPILVRMRDRLDESCSLGMLDGGQVYYVARAEARRIVGVALQVGSRLPAYCTSMGRVLLADLSDAEIKAYLANAPFPARTRRTITTEQDLWNTVVKARTDGYAVVDEELEDGLRSIAAPVIARDGRVVAALNLGAPTTRLSVNDMLTRVLPELRRCADELGALTS